MRGQILPLSPEPPFGEASATRAPGPFSFSLLFWVGSDQLPCRTSHSSHGGHAQSLGRQSHLTRGSHPECAGECSANLSSAKAAAHSGIAATVVLARANGAGSHPPPWASTFIVQQHFEIDVKQFRPLLL